MDRTWDLECWAGEVHHIPRPPPSTLTPYPDSPNGMDRDAHALTDAWTKKQNPLKTEVFQRAPIPHEKVSPMEEQ